MTLTPKALMPEWRPIETAPELDRVLVAGWQKASKRTEGYWWMHEDFIVNGKPDAHPDALLWHPFPERPNLPDPTAAAGCRAVNVRSIVPTPLQEEA